MRSITELVEVPHPSWPLVRDALAASFATTSVLPPEPDRCRMTLLQVQVTARSPLGAIILNTGGILVHDGWVRVYGGSGGGPGQLPSLATVNCFPRDVDLGWAPKGGLIIAHDVLGGVYALNGMDAAVYNRPGPPGRVVYFSPLSLRWEDLEMGHGQWLSWLLGGGSAGHYHDLLWPGWREEVAGLELRDGITTYPFPWTEEAQHDMAVTERKAVPLSQILDLHTITCEQLGTGSPGRLGRV